MTNCQRGSRGARRSAATARRAARPEREAHQGTSMPIQVTCFASLLPPAMTSKTQSRPISMCDRSRCSIAVHRCYFILRAQPRTHRRERVARRRFDSRAPCPCRLADASAGLARSHAAGRPRSADTPREGWRHMPRLLSNAPGTLVFSFSTHRRGARETARRALDRRSAARASPTGPARQPRDPAPAPLIDTPSLTEPTPAAPPPRRAANSDRAVVQGAPVESRSETRGA